MDINDNTLSNILNIIKNNNNCSDNLKILNIFSDNKLPIYKIKEEYKNIANLDFKLEDTNAENISIYEDEKFDYIILDNILEKLVNPGTFLNNMKNHIKPNGIVICNVVNVMYRGVVKDILNGKFTYCDSGILNKSNLRFFTLQEINSLLDREGYEIKQILAILMNSSKEEEDLVNSLCNITNESLKLNFNAYSYTICGTPKITKTLFDYVLSI